ncbi:zf-BED domain-containing protein [Salix suchowensis]|nr:zf-BED domain-containing protein [Salix suchowensis]
MVPNKEKRTKVDLQLDIFVEAKGLFGIEVVVIARDKKLQLDELQNLAIRVLSLTCSSSGCERNWSAFEMKKMNDLVFVTCNLKMNDKGKRQLIDFDEGIDELTSDDEWVTEREGHGSSSNINLFQAIDSATQKKKWKRRRYTPATQVDFETSNSRSLGLNIVGVRSSTSNISISTSGSTNNPFDRDAIDASLGHIEGDETKAGFSLHCTPTKDLF